MGNLTAEEVVKITLGIIGIGFLIYLSVSLIGIFTYKTANEQAKATMDDLNEIATALKEGQTTEFLIEGPKEWLIIFEDNQMCFCPKIEDKSIAPEKVREEQLKICENKGVCQENKNNFKLMGKELSCNLNIVKGNQRIIENCFYVNSLKNLILEKTELSVNILSNYISNSEEPTRISGTYGSEKIPRDFILTTTQFGKDNYLVISLDPILKVKEEYIAANPFIFLEKKDEKWLHLRVGYRDENKNIHTTKRNLLVGEWGVEMGYVSLEDGSVWLSNALFENFFEVDSTLIQRYDDIYKESYKTNLILDTEQLKKLDL